MKKVTTIDPPNINRIVREYYEQLHANKFNNLEFLTDRYYKNGAKGNRKYA